MLPTYNLNKFLMVRPSILDTLKNYASLFFVYNFGQPVEYDKKAVVEVRYRPISDDTLNLSVGFGSRISFDADKIFNIPHEFNLSEFMTLSVDNKSLAGFSEKFLIEDLLSNYKDILKQFDAVRKYHQSPKSNWLNGIYTEKLTTVFESIVEFNHRSVEKSHNGRYLISVSFDDDNTLINASREGVKLTYSISGNPFNNKQNFLHNNIEIVVLGTPITLFRNYVNEVELYVTPEGKQSMVVSTEFKDEGFEFVCTNINETSIRPVRTYNY